MYTQAKARPVLRPTPGVNINEFVRTHMFQSFNNTLSFQSKFGAVIAAGTKGCNDSWDGVLGKKWDVLPATKDGDLDTLIKTMRFTRHNEFGFSEIRIHMATCKGRYMLDDDYRSIVLFNQNEAVKEYTYVLNL